MKVIDTESPLTVHVKSPESSPPRVQALTSPVSVSVTDRVSIVVSPSATLGVKSDEE